MVREFVNADIDFQSVNTTDDEFAPQHPRTKYHRPLELRGVPAKKEFVIWDGEGADNPDDPTRQDYILLGYYDGKEHKKLVTGKALTTKECLEFIASVGDTHPSSTYDHVSFAFGYDVNMILRSLSRRQFMRLRKTNHISAYGYNIEHIPRKWLRVTRVETAFRPKVTVKIQDMFGFFQCALVKALEDNIPDHPLMSHLDEIKAGKSQRGSFTYDDLAYVTKYWEIENVLAHALINHLRDMMYDEKVQLYITQWFGPGAVASYGFKKHKIDAARNPPPASIYTAARYAYAGGRFEMFQTGHFKNVWAIDLNSAYPAAMTLLPDLLNGYWRLKMRPTELQEFGVYYVRMSTGPITMTKKPAPLFHRDKRHLMTFPWITEGWYWAPEVEQALEAATANPAVKIEVMKGYEFVEWTNRPFSFIRAVFDQRARLKAAKDGAQYPLKVFLNSLYGKTAQRTGWERRGKAPRWHQLEWAGWITSKTRAQMYSILKQIPPEHLIAVETDGIYTTYDPALLGIENSKNLGEWEITHYESITYLQSGVYAFEKSPGEWETKYRGMDKGSLTPEMMVEHTKKMKANMDVWPTLSGPSTRFTGYGLALQLDRNDEAQFHDIHARWVADTKVINIGNVGKRVHKPKLCTTCRSGLSAYEKPHTLFVNSDAHTNPLSYPHPIPWIDSAWNDEEVEIEKLEIEYEEYYAY